MQPVNRRPRPSASSCPCRKKVQFYTCTSESPSTCPFFLALLHVVVTSLCYPSQMSLGLVDLPARAMSSVAKSSRPLSLPPHPGPLTISDFNDPRVAKHLLLPLRERGIQPLLIATHPETEFAVTYWKYSPVSTSNRNTLRVSSLRLPPLICALLACRFFGIRVTFHPPCSFPPLPLTASRLPNPRAPLPRTTPVRMPPQLWYRERFERRSANWSSIELNRTDPGAELNPT